MGTDNDPMEKEAADPTHAENPDKSPMPICRSVGFVGPLDRTEHYKAAQVEARGAAAVQQSNRSGGPKQREALNRCQAGVPRSTALPALRKIMEALLPFRPPSLPGTRQGIVRDPRRFGQAAAS